MRIESKKIKNIKDLLLKSDLTSIVDTRGTLFLPIEDGEIEEENTEGLILLESKRDGSFRLIKPGLIIVKDKETGEADVELAYVSIEYAIPFNIKKHHNYLKRAVLNNKELMLLSDHECYIVRRESILASFTI